MAPSSPSELFPAHILPSCASTILLEIPKPVPCSDFVNLFYHNFYIYTSRKHFLLVDGVRKYTKSPISIKKTGLYATRSNIMSMDYKHT